MTAAPALRVRDATLDDVTAVADLERTSFADPWGPESVAAELAAPDRIVRAVDQVSGAGADDDARIVGWSSTSVVADTADLLRVAVSPQARRHGLGRVLVDDVLRGAATAGAERVLLEVAETNTAARALYAATGFLEIHRRRRYYPDGTDALVLERVLA